MEHVRWLAEPALDRPVLISAFSGWNDAGDAASSALRALIEAWGAAPLAVIDPEIFTDFATVRPSIALRDDESHGSHRYIEWPNVELWSASLPTGDVVLVIGPEPALRWKLFAHQVTNVATRLGASMCVSLGALLADVPHSRPVQVIGTSTDLHTVDEYHLQLPHSEGPTGIVGVLGSVMADIGIPTASLWAAVPGYAAQIPSPKAAVALIDRACAILHTPAPLTALTASAHEYDARVSAFIAGDDEITEYVRRLVLMADDPESDWNGSTDEPHSNGSADQPDSSGAGLDGPPPREPPVDGDLMAEVEQFLRELDDPDEPDPS